MDFEAYIGFSSTTAALHLSGDMTERDVPQLRSLVDQAATRPVSRLVLYVAQLSFLTGAGVRCLALAQQLMPDTEIIIDGASEPIREALRLAGLERSMTVTVPSDVPEESPAGPET
jgi:anti-anti-sigma factor